MLEAASDEMPRKTKRPRLKESWDVSRAALPRSLLKNNIIWSGKACEWHFRGGRPRLRPREIFALRTTCYFTIKLKKINMIPSSARGQQNTPARLVWQIACFHGQLAVYFHHVDAVVYRADVHEPERPRGRLDNLQHVGIGVRYLN